MLSYVWSYAGRIVELRVRELTDDDRPDLASLAAVAKTLGLCAFEQEIRLWRVGPCEARKPVPGFPSYLVSISEVSALQTGMRLVTRWLDGTPSGLMRETLPPLPRPYHIHRGYRGRIRPRR